MEVFEVAKSGLDLDIATAVLIVVAESEANLETPIAVGFDLGLLSIHLVPSP